MKNPFRIILNKSLGGALCIAAVAAPVSGASAPDLPSYQADLSQTSVSGLSSGAFMASQFHVAFSSTLVGAGIIAGGPFYCAGAAPKTAFLETAMSTCMMPRPGQAPDASALLQKARAFEQAGQIDSLAHLKKARVYLFSGTADKTVSTAVVDQAAAFYKLAGVPLQHIKYLNSVPAGHAISTDNSSNTPCAVTAAPFINDCRFMQSHEILRHIYGELNPPSTHLSGQFHRFDQKKYMSSWVHAYFSSMSDEGQVYVPKSCETQTCKVHIAFHGCEQYAGKIDDRFYRGTGYNELADSNRIIVLYPQTERRADFFPPYNPKGCWDFWGYSSLNPFAPNFYSKSATQMAAVKAMLDQLGRPRK